KDFWDAVMSADARMTAWLIGPASAPKDAPAVEALRTLYREATERLPASDREWDSVVDQWRLLARFLRLRNGGGDPDGKAQALEALTGEYRPGRPAASASPGTATASEEAASPPQAQSQAAPGAAAAPGEANAASASEPASEPASGAGSKARPKSRAKSPAQPKPGSPGKSRKGK
ncbi:MAG TPA: hypothetical protein PK375_08545, partial [Rhodocyclaceae bacterium]|nr:hypothetical protein [Rhodocyclaceae bacterium]